MEPLPSLVLWLVVLGCHCLESIDAAGWELWSKSPSRDMMQEHSVPGCPWSWPVSMMGCTLRCVLCHSWALTSHGWLNFPAVATFSICLVSSKTDTTSQLINTIGDSYFTKDALGKWWWWFNHQVVSHSCDPMDCSLPGSFVHWILQARILEWVAISFSTPGEMES